MNNKGQALVEFILILPIFTLLIFGMIEIGNIIYQKYNLETHIDPIIELYMNEPELITDYINKNDLHVTFMNEGELVTLTIDKNIKLITPGLTNFLGNPFRIEVKRSFYKGDIDE